LVREIKLSTSMIVHRDTQLTWRGTFRNLEGRYLP